VAKLIPQGILEESQISNEILPMFLKFSETVLEDEDGMQLMAQMFGHFIFSIYSQFEELIIKNAQMLCRFYELCTKSKDA